MKLLEVTKIGDKEIEYINQLTVKGMSQRDIVKHELGDGATPVEIEGHFKTFRGRMKRSNYSYNPEKKIYEFKEKSKKNSDKKTDGNEPKNDGEKRGGFEQVKTPSVQKKSSEKTENLEQKYNSIEKENEKEVEQTSTKKRGSYKSKNKIVKTSKANPLFIESALDIAEIVCKSAGKKEDRVGTGVYVISDIAEDFAKLEDALYYLPGYALIDVALISASCHMNTLEKSAVFERFTNIVREDKVAAKKARNKEDDENKDNDENNHQGGNKNKENENKKNRKKQTNVKLCNESIKAINKLSHHFAFLNKSEIINLSMYALSQSAQVSFIKNEDVKNEK